MDVVCQNYLFVEKLIIDGAQIHSSGELFRRCFSKRAAEDSKWDVACSEYEEYKSDIGESKRLVIFGPTKKPPPKKRFTSDQIGAALLGVFDGEPTNDLIGKCDYALAAIKATYTRQKDKT
jgi:hypothetical protein